MRAVRHVITPGSPRCLALMALSPDNTFALPVGQRSDEKLQREPPPHAARYNSFTIFARQPCDA